MAIINKEDLKIEIGDLIWKMATNLVHLTGGVPCDLMDSTLSFKLL